ncbi:MAG: hypothetical protein U0521_01825 [Anaerolineae bacterium]
MQIGIEVGRASAALFMDLTGRDPDVASNLLKLMLVAPDMDASASTTPQVALEVTFADQPTVTMPESISPDSDYFWADRRHRPAGAPRARHLHDPLPLRRGRVVQPLGRSKVDASLSSACRRPPGAANAGRSDDHVYVQHRDRLARPGTNNSLK